MPGSTWRSSAERERVEEDGTAVMGATTMSVRDQDRWRTVLNGLRRPAKHDEE